jgi:hypothetical protein
MHGSERDGTLAGVKELAVLTGRAPQSVSRSMRGEAAPPGTLFSVGPVFRGADGVAYLRSLRRGVPAEAREWPPPFPGPRDRHGWTTVTDAATWLFDMAVESGAEKDVAALAALAAGDDAPIRARRRYWRDRVGRRLRDEAELGRHRIRIVDLAGGRLYHPQENVMRLLREERKPGRPGWVMKRYEQHGLALLSGTPEQPQPAGPGPDAPPELAVPFRPADVAM